MKDINFVDQHYHAPIVYGTKSCLKDRALNLRNNTWHTFDLCIQGTSNNFMFIYQLTSLIKNSDEVLVKF